MYSVSKHRHARKKTIEKRKDLCPYCNGEMEIWVTGNQRIIKKCLNVDCGIMLNKHDCITNKSLNNLRKQCHQLFDDIWKNNTMKRNKAYEWMAKILQLQDSDPHIGKLDERKCLELIEILKRKQGITDENC